jgi:hypothetical protein
LPALAQMQGRPVSPLKPSFASAGTNADGLFP